MTGDARLLGLRIRGGRWSAVTARTGLRLWFQGLVPLTEQSQSYFDARAEHARTMCDGQTVVDFRSAPPRFFPPGVSPADMARTRGGERLFELLVADAAIKAEAEGYDALAIGVIQDSGLKLARTLVDIPVAGYGQAAALLSRCWGSHLGVLAFNPDLFSLISGRLSTHVPGGVLAVEDVRLSYEEVLRSFTDAAAGEWLRERVSAAAARLVSAGADVLVPGQTLLSEAVWHVGLRQVAGAVLIDGLAATVTLAESMVTLRQRTGITASRNTGGWRQPEAPVRDMIARNARAAAEGFPT